MSGGRCIGGEPLLDPGTLEHALLAPPLLHPPQLLDDADAEALVDVDVDALVDVEPGRWGNDGQLVVRGYAGVGGKPEAAEAWMGVIPNAARTECARCCGCGVPLPLALLGLSSDKGGGLGARECSVSVRRGPRNGDVLGVGCQLLPPPRIVKGSESLVLCSDGGDALARRSAGTIWDADREWVVVRGRERIAGSREAGVICHAGPLSRRWFLLDFSRSLACERRNGAASCDSARRRASACLASYSARRNASWRSKAYSSSMATVERVVNAECER